ncbi:hypothetical protein ACFLSJ_01490 [Verrucomicrobiota bacterium]
MIAREALESSEKSFLVESRPYLIVTPDKPKSRDSFIKCSATHRGSEIEILFKVENAGSTPAHAITIDDAEMEMHFRDSSGQDVTDKVKMDLDYVFPEQAALGPSQKTHVLMRSSFTKYGDQIDRMKQLLTDGAKLPAHIVVSYDGVFGNQTNRYTSVTKVLVYEDHAELLTSEMR